MRLALSTTRLVCQRCGLELASLGVPLPQRPQPTMPPTTIKRLSSKHRR